MSPLIAINTSLSNTCALTWGREREKKNNLVQSFSCLRSLCHLWRAWLGLAGPSLTHERGESAHTKRHTDEIPQMLRTPEGVPKRPPFQALLNSGVIAVPVQINSGKPLMCKIPALGRGRHFSWLIRCATEGGRGGGIGLTGGQSSTKSGLARQRLD